MVADLIPDRQQQLLSVRVPRRAVRPLSHHLAHTRLLHLQLAQPVTAEGGTGIRRV